MQCQRPKQQHSGTESCLQCAACTKRSHGPSERRLPSMLNMPSLMSVPFVSFILFATTFVATSFTVTDGGPAIDAAIDSIGIGHAATLWATPSKLCHGAKVPRARACGLHCGASTMQSMNGAP